MFTCVNLLEYRLAYSTLPYNVTYCVLIIYSFILSYTLVFCFAGYTLSNKTFNSVVKRYANRDGKITFEDFILCAVRLRTVFGTLQNVMSLFQSENVLVK